MLDGKILRGLTGTPMRRSERANISLADAEPEPLTLANLTTKSLTDAMRAFFMSCGLSRGRATRVSSARHAQAELLHVPRACRAALCTQTAMQADVFVLHHHAPGLQQVGDIQRLIGMSRRRTKSRTKVRLGTVAGEGDAVGRADVDTRIAFDALAGGEHR